VYIYDRKTLEKSLQLFSYEAHSVGANCVAATSLQNTPQIAITTSAERSGKDYAYLPLIFESIVFTFFFFSFFLLTLCSSSGEPELVISRYFRRRRPGCNRLPRIYLSYGKL
jgi:hypothetical protein